MAGAQSGGDGDVEALEPGDKPAPPLKLARQYHLPQHAVDLIGLRADVLDKYQLALAPRSVGGAERGRENAEAPSIEDAARTARAQRTHSLLQPDLDQPASESGLQARQMDPVLEIEIGGGHGPMKSNQAGLIEQPGLQCGVVAVCKERFGMAANEIEIEAAEQVIRSVAAAGTNDGGDRGVGKGVVQIGEAVFDRARKVRRVLAAGVFGGECVVAQSAQRCNASGNALVLRAAGRGYDSDAGARRDGRRLEQRFSQAEPRLPRSGARGRSVSFPCPGRPSPRAACRRARAR